MPKRQIKKSVIHYQDRKQQTKTDQQAILNKQPHSDRSRSRQKHKPQQPIKVEDVDISNRRARLLAMRKAAQPQDQLPPEQHSSVIVPQVIIKIEDSIIPKPSLVASYPSKAQPPAQAKKQQRSQGQEQEQSDEEVSSKKVLMKPVFIAKAYREEDATQEERLRQQERKRKNNRYTTKLLLEQSKYQDSEEQNQNTDSQDQNQTGIPGDDDKKNQQYEFQLWKIRELKRIRRDQEERRKHQAERAEIDRRRMMTNEQILIQNRALGSDATDNSASETKYVFLQKYYHRGAFYQDNDDPVFQRDYNLPTPMEMQDKSMLPQILQKRIGNFGKKGQSKYTHLTAEDTSDLNPLTRADESLLEYWKRRTAGYKGQGNNL